MISIDIMYSSIRQEILDQKKCQFNLFGACLTITAAILAYASSKNTSPLVFIAPILLNVLGVTLILDKAKSIQRMVGYLQYMEKHTIDYVWMWEYHLSKFRIIPGKSCGSEGFRRHSYILTVASFLIIVNIFCACLYFWGPTSTQIRASSEWLLLSEFYGAMNVFVISFVLLGIIITVRRWIQLIFGQYTNEAIKKRWEYVLNNTEH